MLERIHPESNKPETYSSSVKAGGFLFLSHQGGATSSDDVKVQLQACFDNLEKVLAKSGGTLEDLVKVNMLLKHKDDFPKCEDVFYQRLTSGFPARTTYVTDFVSPKLLVQIDAVAFVGENG